MRLLLFYTYKFFTASLLKLTEFKTIIDPSITSLHYLTANMVRTLFYYLVKLNESLALSLFLQLHAAPQLHLELLPSDMPAVPEAAKISSDALNMSLEGLLRGLKLLENELKATEKAQQKGNQTVERRLIQLRLFEDTASAAIKALQEEFKVTADAVYETGRFFGDESAHQSSK